ncbi:MAG: single-stranded-DNA-specific exonuclease RecJ [Thermodesulfobacteriota bacterium]|nr:single-stranded-DNA-specific exonuclease RecJ [Thermodesulfobacteriota bacterium]
MNRIVWKIRPFSSLASELAREAGLSLLQAQLLINRGISDFESAEFFLRPRLADMADPMLLKDMDEALAVILETIENQERITIYGDYDADGLTATALLSNFFSSCEIPVSCCIPNRLNDGYGLNKAAVERIAANGPGLIITVDCGISDGKETALARGLGMKVIVTDHHQIPEGFNFDYPAINPHRADCRFPFKDLAGVGIAFFLAVAVRSALRKKGWFVTRPEPDLREYLDLASLGTVADRVPLRDQNRILVKGGMETMSRPRWAGIRAMKDVAGIRGRKITTDDLAFRLAPRLNAPGRMGDHDTGILVLTVEKPILAKALAEKVNAANSERQSVERHILDQVEDMIKCMERIGDLRSLVVAGEEWHKGVLGIVASRLVERYHRPSLVISIQDGVAVGSGRSIAGFNLHGALTQLGHLFDKFGGHARAAGFTLKADNLDMVRGQLEGLARKSLREEDMIPTIDVDVEISLKDVTPAMVNQIKALSPFGEGNPEPLFLARSLEVLGSWVVGERHLKMKVRQGRGKVFEAIGFGLSDRLPLGGKALNMVFTPELNPWQGYETIQLRIADFECLH